MFIFGCSQFTFDTFRYYNYHNYSWLVDMPQDQIYRIHNEKCYWKSFQKNYEFVVIKF